MRKLYAFLFLSGLVVFAGCAGSQQAQNVEKSGFIPGYVKLRKGKEGEALFRYINPAVNWRDYKKVIIDPVAISGSQTKKVSPEDLQRLTDFFWVQLRDELKNDYEIVDEPGIGVMQLSVAITEAEASNPTLDTISSVVPSLRLLGMASVEGKIVNSLTGTELMAAVDRRAGTKNPSEAGYKWSSPQSGAVERSRA